MYKKIIFEKLVTESFTNIPLSKNQQDSQLLALSKLRGIKLSYVELTFFMNTHLSEII